MITMSPQKHEQKSFGHFRLFTMKTSKHDEECRFGGPWYTYHINFLRTLFLDTYISPRMWPLLMTVGK